AEIDYLLRETNRVIPQAGLTRGSVLYTYSGVRPLPFREDETRNAGITRRHFIHDHAPKLENLLSIVGGKITTYRNLSEQAVNLIFKKLGRRSPPCATAHTPLPGARATDFPSFAESFKQERSIDEGAREHLLRVYGTRATEVLEMAEGQPELLKPLGAATRAIRAEVLFSFRRELARTLADCLLRRTMTGMGREAGLDVIEEAAAVARQYLDWSEERALKEIAAYKLERYAPC
ncbi:MAG TPA: glycerol-3-phosphate dehydrogenase C-terminal domain-containing protein, partial [Pyrinomonadaceae bacterium]|nr:glycerol-3-phosphate dehydrogenase C-terminal domain-containing protein [Pyrinomonadaceae bacterium]